MSKKKKQEQLGMNPSTASHKLVKDLLFYFIQQNNIKCHQCGNEMTREDFSIEHIIPWLDSEDPVGLYFNIDNIGFSHLKCNIGAARRVSGLQEHGISGYKKHGCRCEICKEANRQDTYKHRNLKI